jgi:signal transduction histidine kinase
MIKELRKKFILINMSLVSLVMIIIFASICISSYERMKDESYQVMERVIDSHEGTEPPLQEIGDKPARKSVPMVPIFSVTVDKNGEIISKSKENVAVSDEVIAEVTQKVIASGKTEGIFYEYAAALLMRETPEGNKIAFADMGREIDTLTNQLFILFLGGLGGLLAFLAISVFLSGWALRPAEKAWEQQKQFVADASHELKTPLTVILTNIGILLSHRKDTIEQQSKWVEYIQTEGIRMKKLVDDLLFLAKIDADQKPVMTMELNLNDAVWSCLLPFEPIAYEQGITINSEIDPDIRLLETKDSLNS